MVNISQIPYSYVQTIGFVILSIYMTTDWKLVRKLKLLGFEANEARIYLAALELGPSSMWQIHQKCGVKRTTCYQIFEKFIESGVGSKTFESKHTIYSVVPPENLAVSIEHKKDEFLQSLPQFSALLSHLPSKPEITLYKGIEGVRQVYYQGLSGPKGGEQLILATPQFWFANAEDNEAYIAERLKKKISLRMILPDTKENHSMLKNDKKELRRTRFISKKDFDPPVETQIFPNRITYIAHSEREPFATVIENTAIAEAERQKFELLWEIAKKI